MIQAHTYAYICCCKLLKYDLVVKMVHTAASDITPIVHGEFFLNS